MNEEIAIITDTHFGARNDSQAFLNYFERFYEEIFWPEIKRRGITTVLHLGDLVDRKKFIAYNSYNTMRRAFLDKFDETCQLFIIPGNHDSYYKNTLEVNAVSEICSSNPWITTIYDPTEIKLYGKHVVMLPWLCDDNIAYANDLIKKSNAQVCMGHLELTGFRFNRGRICTDGFDPAPFAKFKRTFSGHFHHKSSQDNIYYLGAPYEMTWEDWNDARGFHIYNLDKDALTFIQNPFRIHEKVEYTSTLDDDFSSVDFSFYEGKIVKLLVKEKNDITKYMNFIERMEASGVISLHVIENQIEIETSETNSDVMVEELEDTLTILNSFVEENDFGVDKDKLVSLMTTLYKDALYIEV